MNEYEIEEISPEHREALKRICVGRSCSVCPFYHKECPDNFSIKTIEEAYKMLFGENVIIKDITDSEIERIFYE